VKIKLLISLFLFNSVVQASLNNDASKAEASAGSKSAIKEAKKVFSDKLFEAKKLLGQPSQSFGQYEDIAVNLARSIDHNEYVNSSPKMQVFRNELYDEEDSYRYLFCLVCLSPTAKDLKEKRVYLEEKINKALLHVNNVQVDLSVITQAERK
jgi:hypothetical protein